LRISKIYKIYLFLTLGITSFNFASFLRKKTQTCHQTTSWINMESLSLSVHYQAVSHPLSFNLLIPLRSSSKTKENTLVKLRSILTLSILPKKLSRRMVLQVTIFSIFIGLYKGVDSAIMRQFIYCGMRLGIYKALEDRIRHKENRNLSFG